MSNIDQSIPTLDAPELTDYQQAFTAALRAGDETAAATVVERACAAGVAARTIYLDIFAPAMVAIGTLWERNELSVAEEHLATAITERLIGQLSPTFELEDGATGGTVMLGCVEGERHALGLRMLADLFRQRGWRVLFLGADVPTADWVQLAVRSSADAVAISARDERHLPQVRALIMDLRATRSELLVIVGGAAFNNDPAGWRTVGADIYHPDPRTAVEIATARYSVPATYKKIR